VSEDPQLEAFVRQFRPRPPAPLGARRARRRSGWPALLASAAAVAIALGGVLLTPRTPKTAASAPPRPTLGVLNAALRAGNYEAALDEMDARLLPDPARPGGALAMLADVKRDW
jgi:hypothetical protein